MKNIVCKIKSKIGIIYSFEDIEMTSLDETRQKLEKTANWMNAYENICKAINSDILGYEIADKSAYSMDLPRFLEKCLKID